MRSNFNRLSKPEVDFLLDNCNFSEDEIILFKMASAGSSDVQIAEKLCMCVSSITKKKKIVGRKIKEFLEVSGNMTTIYVNGKRVTKEELKNNEIQIESVKKIPSEKLTKSK